LAASGCGAGGGPQSPSAPAAAARGVTPSASTSPTPSSSPANAYGTFTLAGWLSAAGVGPVAPLAFATPTGAVPGVPLGHDAAGRVLSGAAPGTQCYHASSSTDLDQYEALIVLVVHGRRYRLSIAAEFARPGAGGGEATPPAGGRMTDATGGTDELRFDPESVALADDPMFVASFSDGDVVIAPTLRGGSIDVTLHGLAPAGGVAPAVHLSGTWTCP
jgi:hypothetical protein